MSLEIDAGAIVYQKKDNEVRYLLLKSATSSFWGYPKGHQEKGETLIEAARREIFEETGLITQINNKFNEKVTYNMKNGNKKELTLFIAEVSPNLSIKKQDEEISDFNWFGYEDALKQLTFENLVDPLKKANLFIEER
ncbi:NUDIX domain-containing protein [Lactobacillus sp. S2-2]|uniref:bis(5'-nucleosyl)-tetraphosphatase n=1 Tax=Lactobacillus sp. S2-2 TaxID=2692917 RepID=UPI001F26378D|nr:NUDIX domain-containing protein [Lactobacillus sp. S2-2]MCF6514728.1 NUDIX domain-containing protein [Lactobacillus sp. S2-2]